MIQIAWAFVLSTINFHNSESKKEKKVTRGWRSQMFNIFRCRTFVCSEHSISKIVAASVPFMRWNEITWCWTIRRVYNCCCLLNIYDGFVVTFKFKVLLITLLYSNAFSSSSDDSNTAASIFSKTNFTLTLCIFLMKINNPYKKQRMREIDFDFYTFIQTEFSLIMLAEWKFEFCYEIKNFYAIGLSPNQLQFLF